MILEFSFDDGHKDDLRVAKILEQYGFKGMFYVPYIRGPEGISNDELVELSQKHDIGFHSFSHPSDIKKSDIRAEVTTGRSEFEEMIGRPITSFCYPKGKHDQFVIEEVKKAGYREARTVEVLRTDLDWNYYTKPTTIHVYPKRREYEEQYSGMSWVDISKMKFLTAHEYDSYFHLWGHGWEITKFDLWDEFEEVIKYIRDLL